ncbi:alpha/beta fold hydrolase [bacterium]|nr:alpha/beta fold hydrolase [bacterium]
MKLHFVEYGQGDKTLVILHGLLGSERNWHSLAREMSREIHIYALDLRNHGASPHHPVHTFDAMCDDLELFIDEHIHEHFYLLGHSMGGQTAMKYAFRHGETLRGLIIEDIAPRSYDRGLTKIFNALHDIDLTKFTEKKDVDAALSEWVPNPAVRHFLMTNLVRHENQLSWRVNVPALTDFAENEIARFRVDANERYDGPTLFIGGELSGYDLSKERHLITQYFPQSRLEMIQGANHWIHFDSKAVFMQLVLDFINAHDHR